MNKIQTPVKDGGGSTIIDANGRQIVFGLINNDERAEIIRAINALADYERLVARTRWIPVEEKPLPKSGRVYATLQTPRNPNGRVVILNIAEKLWRDVKVVAWMPLPDPFVRGKE